MYQKLWGMLTEDKTLRKFKNFNDATKGCRLVNLLVEGGNQPVLQVFKILTKRWE